MHWYKLLYTRRRQRGTDLVGAGHHGPERGEVRVDPLPPAPLRLAVALERHRRLVFPAVVSLPLGRLLLRGGRRSVQQPAAAAVQDDDRRRRRRSQTVDKPVLVMSMATAETAVEPVEGDGPHVHVVEKSFHFQDDDDPRGTRT